jgi:DNA-binding CsgD family transcriptional regulator
VAASYGLSGGAELDAMPRPIPGNAQLTDRVLRSKAGTVLQDAQINSDALAATALRRTGSSSSRVVAWACVIVGRDARQVVCLEVYAGAGRAAHGPDLRDLLRQLAPHLGRAWRLGRTVPCTHALPASERSPLDVHADAAPAPALAALPQVARLRVEFGLTKAEARLALRLAEGASLASAAQAFNVKLTTIRSQLQQVFAKTGTCRQTELVAMILSRGYGTRGALSPAAKRDRQAAALAEP